LGHDHDPDRVTPLLFATVVATENLLKAVRSRMAPSISMSTAELTAAVQEAREERDRKAREYHVDEWQVKAHTRTRKSSGKEYSVRAFTARPRKEQNGEGA
jgi:hypothetical protein